MTLGKLCEHCDDLVPDHATEEHSGLCCDCAELSWGFSLTRINAERAARGAPPLERWPGRRADGEQTLWARLWARFA